MINDGLIFFSYTTNTQKILPLFGVDINGKKGPNKWGYDVFVLNLRKVSKSSGIKIEPGSSVCHPVEKGGKNAQDYYWEVF